MDTKKWKEENELLREAYNSLYGEKEETNQEFEDNRDTEIASNPDAFDADGNPIEDYEKPEPLDPEVQKVVDSITQYCSTGKIQALAEEGRLEEFVTFIQKQIGVLKASRELETAPEGAPA